MAGILKYLLFLAFLMSAVIVDVDGNWDVHGNVETKQVGDVREQTGVVGIHHKSSTAGGFVQLEQRSQFNRGQQNAVSGGLEFRTPDQGKGSVGASVGVTVDSQANKYSAGLDFKTSDSGKGSSGPFVQAQTYQHSSGFKQDTVLAGMTYQSSDKSLGVSVGGGASMPSYNGMNLGTHPQFNIGFRYNFPA